jgi:hypothetical protein
MASPAGTAPASLLRFHIFRNLGGECWCSLLLVCRSALLGAEFPGAEMATLFHVKALRQRRKHGEFAGELFAAFQNDFGAVVAFLHFPANLDDLPCKLAHVANICQIVGEDHDCKTAQPVVITKIEIVSSLAPGLDAYHSPGDALGFTNVFVRLVERNASGKGEPGQRADKQKREQIDHEKILGRESGTSATRIRKKCFVFPK